MAHSVARLHQMERFNHKVIHSDTTKERLRNHLDMVKYEARRDIDLRIAQKVFELKKAQHERDLQRVRLHINRAKDSTLIIYFALFEAFAAGAFLMTLYTL
jgi:hypothetical protein